MGSLVGAGIGAVGSLLSSRNNRKAAKSAAQAAQFDPWSGSTAFGGSINFDKANNTFSASASPEQQAWFNMLQGQGTGYLGGQGYGQDFINFAGSNVAGQMPGLFAGSQLASMQMPTGAANQFIGNSLGREQAAMMGGMGFLNEAMQTPGGFGVQDPYTAMAMNQGFRNFNTPDAGSYQDVYDQRLGMLRDAAQPFEQRQFNNLQQNLFDTGRLGSTGGGLQTEAFARGLGQADTQRNLDAMGFAEGLWQRDMNNVMNNRQLGLGMVGQGFGGMSAGSNAMLGNRQLAGNLGLNFLNQAQGFGQGAFQTSAGMSDLINNRALQRLGSAQQMLGFGSSQNLQNINTGLGMLGAQQNMDTQLRNLLAMGGQFGGQQANAGANAGQFMVQGAQNNFGDFLAGMGGGLMDGSFKLPSFGGGNNQPKNPSDPSGGWDG